MKINHLLTVILISYNCCLYAQQNDPGFQLLQQFPGKYFSAVDKKICSVNDQLTKSSIKYLRRLERQEKKLQKKFHGSDTVLFAGIKYDELLQQLKNKEVNKTGNVNKVSTPYNAYLDTLTNSLSFLKEFNMLPGKTKIPLPDLERLQNKFVQSEKIKKYIASRKQQIREALAKYTKIPASLKRQFEKYNKQAYYFSAQLKEYKEMLHDPGKIEKKALNLLSKLPAFQKFMKENSQVASLFALPGTYGTAQGLTGMQTRATIQSLIQQRINSAGPNAQSQLQQNISIAHSEMDKLKAQVNKLSGSDSDIEIPGFKPNTQKTKTFFHRLEYGSNFQFAKSNSFMPATADIGLSIGYKLNDKSIAGVGTSYMLGLGSLRHISVTSQGIGFRSFFDYSIKKQFYASCGYEMNYNSQFKSIQQLKFSTWQQSGLAGFSKKYKITKKVKGEMKLLYDFLAHQHLPKSQPILFRLGYNF